MKRLTAAGVLAMVPCAAAAQSTGVLATKRPITWGMIFALLFLMLGPIKLLGPFAAATKECDRVFRLRLATRAFLFSAAAVTVAAPKSADRQSRQRGRLSRVAIYSLNFGPTSQHGGV